MDDERQQAFMTALVTDHFTLQGARGQVNAEITGRAALYLATVSSTLIALGFVARDRSAFVPFAAAVLPSLLILGEFTFIRRHHHRGSEGRGHPSHGHESKLAEP